MKQEEGQWEGYRPASSCSHANAVILQTSISQLLASPPVCLGQNSYVLGLMLRMMSETRRARIGILRPRLKSVSTTVPYSTREDLS